MSFGITHCYKPWRAKVLNATHEQCQVSLCLTGAVSQRSESNEFFHNICEYEELPGLLQDCERGGCYNTFDSFTDSTSRTIYPVLFDALDTNGDERVDDADDSCQINLIGFSWGGITATDLATRLAEDERVSPSHNHISRMLLLDPYRPWKTLDIPQNVDKARVWRQSASPEYDCSSRAPGGPYTGLAPVCPEGSDCQDVDISSLATFPLGYDPLLDLTPQQVGHCDVPAVARDWLMEALFDLDLLYPSPAN